MLQHPLLGTILQLSNPVTARLTEEDEGDDGGGNHGYSIPEALPHRPSRLHW